MSPFIELDHDDKEQGRWITCTQDEKKKRDRNDKMTSKKDGQPLLLSDDNGNGNDMNIGKSHFPILICCV